MKTLEQINKEIELHDQRTQRLYKEKDRIVASINTHTLDSIPKKDIKRIQKSINKYESGFVIKANVVELGIDFNVYIYFYHDKLRIDDIDIAVKKNSSKSFKRLAEWVNPNIYDLEHIEYYIMETKEFKKHEQIIQKCFDEINELAYEHKICFDNLCDYIIGYND